jgi:DNA-binding transcriptional LysR family regulator
VRADPLGLGVLPLYAVGDELRSGQLRVLSMQPDLPRLRLEAMVYQTRPPTHPAITALLDTLHSTLAQSPELRMGRGG